MAVSTFPFRQLLLARNLGINYLNRQMKRNKSDKIIEAKQAVAESQKLGRQEWIWVAVIAVVAAIVRIIYWLEAGDDPLRGELLLDSLVYHRLATEITKETFWGTEVFFRAPLFPYLLALTYKLAGIQQTAIAFVNMLMGVATAALVYLTSRRWLTEQGSRIAGIAAALYPTLYFFECEIMPTALEVFTFTLTLYLFSLYDRDRNQKHLIWGGIALGLAALARPTILTFALALIIWLRTRHQSSGWKIIWQKYSLILLGLAIVILPCTIRNYAVGGEVVLISSQGGVNFYMGNNKDADGQTAAFPSVGGKLNKYQDHIWSDSKALAEDDARRNLTASEVSSYWRTKGMDFITSNPLSALWLSLKKIYLVFCGEELFNNEDPLSGSRYALLYSIFIWAFGLRFPYGLLAPLFLLGTVLVLRRKSKPWLPLLFVYSQVITVALFFVSSRYRQPLIPAMIIIATAGLFELRELIKRNGIRQLAPYVVALLVLLLALNPPVTIASTKNQSMYYALLGNVLSNQNKNDLAVTELTNATAIDDKNTLAFQYLGMVYAKTGKNDQAIEALKKAESLNPDYEDVKVMLARVYYDKHDYASSLQYIKKARLEYAGATSLYMGLWLGAWSAANMGMASDSKQFLNQILVLNPRDKSAKAMLDSLGVK
jgi:4-amino-4-deoxy-L-arabinose transferase-like glycosyltransferase